MADKSNASGQLLREWRTRRNRSQMDLALEVGVSPRHLSFVETGKSRASPELLLALADQLEVPLRERNALLLASGYAPRYPRTPLNAGEMARVRQTLERILSGHDPYPGLVIDRYWNVVLANSSAQSLLGDLPAELLGPPANVFRVALHPQGLASRTLNFGAWCAHLLGQLHHARSLTGDPEFDRLVEEVEAYPTVSALGDWRRNLEEEGALFVSLRLQVGGSPLSLFTTLTVFGTPHDVTLSELAIELFYPADDETEEYLRAGGPRRSDVGAAYPRGNRIHSRRPSR